MVGAEPVHVAAAGEPVHDRLPQFEGAVRGRVAVGVCACGERILNELGGAINRGADGEVYGSAGVFSRDSAVGGERLPGVFG